ncbi:hypothetical protein PROFUN_01961 [Planoprotostelium fungivorum]|uniref:SRP54-type proteins GTP-binding domain-containing protein n=1 Tax=Planoprotostelium fungivorum TaxID=1890364 RepID=A0A2P6NB01_9EUKA|nr:hypothetical protein PROFUN_01961 [Planoprotostelium fungivorum]
MLDHFTICTKGGIVLWSHTPMRLKGTPINDFIRTILLEERGGEESTDIDQYRLKWKMANDFDLLFIVVYQKMVEALYIDDLLKAVKKAFTTIHKQQLLDIKNGATKMGDLSSFDALFARIVKDLEAEVINQKKEQKKPRPFNKEQKVGKKPAKEVVVEREEPEPVEEEKTEDTEGLSTEEMIERNKMKLRQKMEPKTKTSTKPKAAEGKKVLPKWNVDEGNKKLNYNPESKPEYDDNQTYEAGETKIDDISWIKADDEPASKSLLGNLFSKLTGNKVIQAEDLTDSMETFRQHLITKNVASDIATKLCESVATSLQGQKYPSLSSIKTVIRPAMQSALVRILTPRRHIDILRDALEAKKNKKPYTITFVGVNGVGKSTNLAKVCSYLQQNGLSVMMAACDTFRSGAVEQLKTHARRLKVEVYEKGYQSDATSIACDAIKHAKNNNINVVLIDTAGRMQDNAPLMMSLSQLVNTALPDLVLFVGEALVGNDAVDQLTKFNQALIDLSKDKNPRTIDGIILTKFDTIDDKVGAAISMVYSTGAPIVFLGVGQSYTDLRRMNVDVVTESLLRGLLKHHTKCKDDKGHIEEVIVRIRPQAH